MIRQASNVQKQGRRAMTFSLWSASRRFVERPPSPTTGCGIVTSMRPVHLPLPRGTGIHVFTVALRTVTPRRVFWKVSRGMEGLLGCLSGGMQTQEAERSLRTLKDGERYNIFPRKRLGHALAVPARTSRVETLQPVRRHTRDKVR
jgi:hypothetical protein